MTDIPHLFPGTKIDFKPEAFMAPFMTHDLHFSEISRVPGYGPLEMVLLAAYAQASMQKGKERHAQGDVFLDQPIISIGQLLKSPDGEAYQAIKKVREGLMMHRTGESERCIREILGAINYLAATAILVAEESHNRGIREFEEQQRVFEPDNLDAAIAAAGITVDELATLMSLREGIATVTIGQPLSGDDAEMIARFDSRRNILFSKGEFKLIKKDLSQFMVVGGSEVEGWLRGGDWELFDEAKHSPTPILQAPQAKEPEITCPAYGEEPTREQLIRALEVQNMKIPDYALDHLWGGDVQPPISEMYGLMADEYLALIEKEKVVHDPMRKRLKQGRRTETIRITSTALASWRVETFGDDDSGF